ncbi:MAG: hypothetical protein HY974_03425 [Candidatus Kerfeldbacteria bacterium]|nr:hypothetical protein [Candidatus Kerfeldbacteria bacterium]
MTFYEGLKLIAKLKLPHPTCQFVSLGRELKDLPRISAYAGWTIRTAEVRGAAYKNLYANWLPRRQVLATVDKFQRRLRGQSYYFEWAVSTRGKFIIYRLRDLASEGRALLAKYGLGGRPWLLTELSKMATLII